MGEFFNFVIQLWCNSPPIDTIKIIVSSGLVSGCLVYSVCKMLDNKENKMKIKVGDKVRIVKDSQYSTKYKHRLQKFLGVDNFVGMTGIVKKVDIDGDPYGIKVLKDGEEVGDPNAMGDCFWMKNSELELVKDGEEMSHAHRVEDKKEVEFKIGDYVKVTNKNGNPYGIVDVMLSYEGKTGILVETATGVFRVKFSDKGSDWYNYSKECLELSTESEYNNSCQLVTKTETKKDEPMNPNEWIAFVKQIPTTRDIELSDDAKSWRPKTSVALKTETPKVEETKTPEPTKGSEPMKKLEMTTVNLETRPVDGEMYLIADKEGALFSTEYNEDEDDVVSNNFNVDEVAFYLPMSELSKVVNIPTPFQCEEAFDKENLDEEVKKLSLEDITENFHDWSKSKQDAIATMLRNKGIRV